jgi:hypothetical protein
MLLFSDSMLKGQGKAGSNIGDNFDATVHAFGGFKLESLTAKLRKETETYYR